MYISILAIFFHYGQLSGRKHVLKLRTVNSKSYWVHVCLMVSYVGRVLEKEEEKMKERWTGRRPEKRTCLHGDPKKKCIQR